MSWISLDDAIKVMLAALTNDQFSGALNVVAPQVVSNREFARALSKAKQRLAIPPIPATMVRLMFGEMADAALLASSNIQSSRMQELGVTLDYPDIDSALQKCFA
jgi:NAD dependent epimerase/dehydratase family enzyme